MKVQGGFNKWSIGYKREEDCIEIMADHYPNVLNLKLYDVLLRDVEQLKDMFEELYLMMKRGEI